MPYEYLPDIAIADVAFRAWSDSLEGLFTAAADATMNVMVGDLSTIAQRETRSLKATDAEVDMLLFQALQELVFYKDAEQLLLRLAKVEIHRLQGGYELAAEACGEVLDPARHDLIVDVKAVTLHRFRVARSPEGWEAEVILDI